MKGIVKAVVAAAAVVALGGSALAAQAASTAAKPKAAAAAKSMSATGKIRAFDAATKTVKLTTSKGEESFVLGDAAKVMHSGKAVTDLSTLVGHDAKVHYTGRRTARRPQRRSRLRAWPRPRSRRPRSRPRSSSGRVGREDVSGRRARPLALPIHSAPIVVGQRDAKPLGHAVQCPAIDSHHFGRARPIPANRFEHVQQIPPLISSRLGRSANRLRGHIIAVPSARSERQVRLVDHRISTEQHEPFDRILELAYVAGPLVLGHPRQRAG